MRHLLACFVCLSVGLGPVCADPVAYALEADRSDVGFEVDFGPDVITGSFPVVSADISVDFDAPGRSSVEVVLDIAGARASFPFAAQAVRGQRVLDARSHPQARFQSRSVEVIEDGVARIAGDLTLRGVTRPVLLRAETYRQRGSAPDDFRRLTMTLIGSVARSEFGATGWADEVGDQVRLRITARITRAE
jgi:polyisoprenoid-binding protein YceI